MAKKIVIHLILQFIVVVEIVYFAKGIFHIQSNVLLEMLLTASYLYVTVFYILKFILKNEISNKKKLFVALAATVAITTIYGFDLIYSIYTFGIEEFLIIFFTQCINFGLSFHIWLPAKSIKNSDIQDDTAESVYSKPQDSEPEAPAYSIDATTVTNKTEPKNSLIIKSSRKKMESSVPANSNNKVDSFNMHIDFLKSNFNSFKDLAVSNEYLLSLESDKTQTLDRIFAKSRNLWICSCCDAINKIEQSTCIACRNSRESN